MRGAWFEEYERLWNENDGEPSPESVDEALTERLASQIDRAMDAYRERDL